MTWLPVSVVIPSFNHARFLGEAIDSGLAEAPFELIVVDDGSTDETPEVIRRFGSAVVTVRQPNAGLSAARNAGIARASGRIVQFLDADDVLMRGALSRLVDAAVRMPEATAFYGGWQEMTQAGEPILDVPSTRLAADAFHLLIDPMAVGPPGRFGVRREALVAAGGFDRGLAACEDWDLWLRLAAAGHAFEPVPGIALRYRNASGSMSKDYRRMWRAGTTVLARAAGVHRGCPTCPAALADARRQWRRWCYLSMLAPQLRSQWRAGRPVEAAIAAIAASGEDPGLIPLLARSARYGTRRRREERGSRTARQERAET